MVNVYLLLLVVTSLVPHISANHGCTSCPSNSCSQDRAGEGVCRNERYESESYQTLYYTAVRRSQRYYYSCGFFGWSRCSGTRYWYESQSRYTTRYNARLVCEDYCCSGFQLISGGQVQCRPVCTGGCFNSGTCVDPESCDCPPNWTGQYCNEDVNECESANGGCSDYCSNIPGSHECYCRTYATLNSDGRSCTCQPGFIQNDQAKTCDDIDECDTNNAGCHHECVNLPGNYSCHCDDGYELHEDEHLCLPICTGGCLNGGTCVLPETCSCVPGWTGQNCENDIDECETGTSGCQQNCHNNIGSYYCSCNVGFLLANDQHACLDINECLTNNGGCDHICYNTIGSYYCTCRPGYTLHEDGHTCIAQPCPTLFSPLNGNITCTGAQVTDESCSFMCDFGYKLQGSSYRLCQPNNTWSGNRVQCNILHCPVLMSNEDSIITYPCDTAYQSECNIHCSPSYYNPFDGMDSMMCALQQPVENNTVGWTQRPECQEIQPCMPDPCHHGGSCSEYNGDFFCDCTNTGFEGGMCEWGIIQIDSIPTLSPGIDYSFNISARPDHQLMLLLSLKSDEEAFISPDFVEFDNATTINTVTVSSMIEGTNQIIITLAGVSMHQFITPEPVTFLVKHEESVPLYSANRNLEVDILEPSCCLDNAFTYTCRNLHIVDIVSSCQQTTEGVIPGVSFLKGNNITVPLSFGAVMVDAPGNGFKVESVHVTQSCAICQQIQLFSSSERSSSVQCSSSMAGPQGCYCYRLSAADIEQKLQFEALATTYLSYIGFLLPDWLDLTPLASSRVHLDDSFHTSLTEASKLQEEIYCHHFLPGMATSGLHSVLKYRGNMQVGVNGQVASYGSFIISSSDLICVAVDLCEGYESTLHISMPLAFPYLESPFFATLKEHGWELRIKGISINRWKPLPANSFVEALRPVTYWNGYDSVTPHLGPIAMAFSAALEGAWNISSEINVHLSLNGSFAIETSSIDELISSGLQQSVKVVSMGKTELNIWVFSNRLNFHNADSVGYLTINDEQSDEGCGTHDNRVYFQVMDSYYKEFHHDDIFSRILIISPREVNGERTVFLCPINVTFSLDSNVKLRGLALHSACHDLHFGELVFTNMNHALFAGGQQTPLVCHNNLDSSDPFVLYSWSRNADYHELGAFIAVNTSEGKPTVKTTFVAEEKIYPSAEIEAVVSPWPNTRFMTDIRISEDNLWFFASIMIFGSIPVDISGTATTDRNWNEMTLRLQGSVHKDSHLWLTLEENVKNDLEEVAERASSRLDLATDSLNRAKYQRDTISSQRDMVLEEFQTKTNEFSDFQTGISSKNQEISILQMELNISGEAESLQRELDNLCEIQSCGDTCKSGLVCSSCVQPVQIVVEEQCTATCERVRQVRVHSGYEYFTDYSTRKVCGSGWLISCIPAAVIPNAFTAAACFIGFAFFGGCTTVSYPYQAQRSVYTLTEVVERYSCLKPCRVIRTTYIIAECCQNDPCATVIPDVMCIESNALCREARQAFLLNQAESPSSPGYKLLRIDQLQSELTVLQLQSESLSIEVGLVQSKYDQLSHVYDRLSEAVELGERQLQEIEELNRAGEELSNQLKYHSIDEIFSITNVTFDIFGTGSFPFSFLLFVDYTLNTLALNHIGRASFNFDFNVQESSIRNFVQRLSREVQETLTGGTASRQKRLSSSETLGINWEEYCESLYAMRAVMYTAVESLSTYQATQNSSSINATEVKELLFEEVNLILEMNNSNLSNVINSTILEILTENVTVEHLLSKLPNNPELLALIDTLLKAASTADELVVYSKMSAFLNWQVEMELQMNNTISEYGHTCGSFLDCIATISEVIKEALIVPQLTETNELLSLLPQAEMDFIQLTHRADFELQEAAEKLINMINIVESAVEFDYWCASKPRVMLNEKVDEVILTEDRDLLNLICNASSEWPMFYHWSKDNMTISGADHRELIIESVEPSDAGDYQCTAANHIGSTESAPITVRVYAGPELIQEPENVTTYAESGDQIVLLCSGVGQPAPIWSWYFKGMTSETFAQVPDENSTELRIKSPQQPVQGWYKCVAENEKGVVESREAFVNILGSSVAQFSLPAVVKFAHNSQVRKRPAFGTMSLETGINPHLYTTLNPKQNDLSIDLEEVLSQYIDLWNASIFGATLYQERDLPSKLTFLLGTKLIENDYSSTLVEIFENFTDAKSQLKDLTDILSPLLDVVDFRELNNLMYDDIDYSGVDMDTVIWRCPPGQGFNRTNNMLCVSCQTGHYQKSVEETLSGVILFAYPSCVPCPLGSFQPFEDQTGCTQCYPGSYQNKLGQNSCRPCPRGSYQPYRGESSCSLCPNGTTTDDIGSASVETCKPIERNTEQPSSVQPTEESNRTQLVIILGSLSGILVVGILLTVFGFIGGILYVRKRRKRSKAKSNNGFTFIEEESTRSLQGEWNEVRESIYLSEDSSIYLVSPDTDDGQVILLNKELHELETELNQNEDDPFWEDGGGSQTLLINDHEQEMSTNEVSSLAEPQNDSEAMIEDDSSSKNGEDSQTSLIDEQEIEDYSPLAESHSDPEATNEDAPSWEDGGGSQTSLISGQRVETYSNTALLTEEFQNVLKSTENREL